MTAKPPSCVNDRVSSRAETALLDFRPIRTIRAWYRDALRAWKILPTPHGIAARANREDSTVAAIRFMA